MGPLLPDLDDAVLRPRDGALDEQQVALRVKGAVPGPKNGIVEIREMG